MSYKEYSCRECLNGAELPFSFTMAFQPIVDVVEKKIFSHEALVRGVNGESAGFILSQVNEKQLYQFDQACRVKAIELASRLKMDSYLNINFLPNAVYKPETCIKTTIEACKTFGFPMQRIILEVTEAEKVDNKDHLINIFREYRKMGLLTALDDFGEGYSGLNMLAEFQPDYIKLDRKLISDVDKDSIRQRIVHSIVSLCKNIGIHFEAEGIETYEEYSYLQSIGVRYMQGFYFSKPILEGVGNISWN